MSRWVRYQCDLCGTEHPVNLASGATWDGEPDTPESLTALCGKRYGGCGHATGHTLAE